MRGTACDLNTPQKRIQWSFAIIACRSNGDKEQFNDLPATPLGPYRNGDPWTWKYASTVHDEPRSTRVDNLGWAEGCRWETA